MKREVNVGGVKIGGESPVSIQSMTNTDTRDVASTVEQIKRLQTAGCEIIRVAVPDMEAAEALIKTRLVDQNKQVVPDGCVFKVNRFAKEGIQTRLVGE